MNDYSINVEYHKSHIRLFPYVQGQCSVLERSLSSWNQIYHKYDFSAFMIDEENKVLYIPGGYPIEKRLVYYTEHQYFNDEDGNLINKITIKSTESNEGNSYDLVDKYGMIYGPRDREQEEAINFLKGKFNGRTNPLNYSEKILSLQTGQGKSYCLINYCHHTRKRTMIIVDQDNLAKQWKEYILKYTTLNEDNICIISYKNDSLDKVLSKTNEEKEKIVYYIVIYNTLKNKFDEEPKNITNLFNDLKIGCKVFDEAHLQYKNIFYINCMTECETIYLSATPSRTNESENKVYENMMHDVVLYSPKYFVPYVNIVKYVIDSKINDMEFLKLNKRIGNQKEEFFDIIGYSKLLVTKPVFLDSLFYVLRKIYAGDFTRKKKVAIVLKMIDHTTLVKKALEEYLSDKPNDINITVLTGKTKNKEKALEGDIIISTDKSLGKGIDIPNLEILINYVPISSEVSINQICGRLRKLPDKKVFFVDVVDISVPKLKYYWNNRRRFYKETLASSITQIKYIGG